MNTPESEDTPRSAAGQAAANRRTHEFLAMLSHELRNPLSAITSCLPLLERVPARDPTEQLAREILQRQTLQLRRLVDDLLDVARVTQGKIEMRWAPVDLGALLLTAAETAERTRLHGRRQRFELDLPRRPLRVRGDSLRLEQIFTNLLDNASKYTHEGGTIGLSGAPIETDGQRWVSVIIRDNGMGIEPRTLPLIFELFAQADVPLARSLGGLGIGLTLARSLIHFHGGSIHVTSAGLGKGSTFEVRLPLLAQTERQLHGPDTAEHPDTPPSERRRVLVVEDNLDVQAMLRLLLESWGHQVWVASDGPAGIDAIEKVQPDVALIDIGLPRVDGYEVARRVNKQGPGHRPMLVALTGYSAPEHRERALRSGFDAHMAKPAEPEQLLELLRHSPAPGSLLN